MANHGPVKFRMIVFRPFKGEIMLGKISGSTEHGIKSMCLVPSPVISSSH
jgi:DNA-directed RNA polymerase subunit E'/Rpb7